jgi:hypothetical protein
LHQHWIETEQRCDLGALHHRTAYFDRNLVDDAVERRDVRMRSSSAWPPRAAIWPSVRGGPWPVELELGTAAGLGQRCDASQFGLRAA